jgi:hypothetical protein
VARHKKGRKMAEQAKGVPLAHVHPYFVHEIENPAGQLHTVIGGNWGCPRDRKRATGMGEAR